MFSRLFSAFSGEGLPFMEALRLAQVSNETFLPSCPNEGTLLAKFG